MLKPRLEKFYENIVCDDFILLYDFKNIKSLPCIEHLILSSRSSDFNENSNVVMQSFGGWLLGIAQKSVKTRARKSIALFDIRKNDLLGLKVTCRKSACFNQLDKLLIWVLPKIFSNKVKKEISLSSLASLSGGDYKTDVSFLSKDKVSKIKLEDFKKSEKVSYKSFLANQKQIASFGESSIHYSAKNKPFILKNLSGYTSLHLNSENFTTYKVKLRSPFLNLPQSSCLEQNTCFHNRKKQTLNQNFFTISHASSLVFPEIGELNFFFDSASGFALLGSVKYKVKKNAFDSVGKQFISAFQYPSFIFKLLDPKKTVSHSL